MKPTIRNKVMGGFAGVLTLMAVLAVVSGYAVFSLRHSANQATRVGARLNSIAIEIQVHNLEAQRRVKSYMALAPSSENQQKREMYLEEATFEIHEIQSLVEKATEIAPTASLRTQFQRIAGAATDYQGALNNVVEADKQGSS